MPSVEELSVTAVRSAMAPGFDPALVASELVERSRNNITALRMARARVERGAGWRSGPIGQRARDVLTLAIELCERVEDARETLMASAEIDLTELEPIDLRGDPIAIDVDLELDDTLPA